MIAIFLFLLIAYDTSQRIYCIYIYNKKCAFIICDASAYLIIQRRRESRQHIVELLLFPKYAPRSLLVQSQTVIKVPYHWLDQDELPIQTSTLLPAANARLMQYRLNILHWRHDACTRGRCVLVTTNVHFMLLMATAIREAYQWVWRGWVGLRQECDKLRESSVKERARFFDAYRGR